MAKIPVVHPKNLPVKLPIVATVVLLLALDHWRADGLVRGITYTLAAIVWLVVLYALFWGQEPVNMFEKKEPRINSYPPRVDADDVSRRARRMVDKLDKDQLDKASQ